MITKSYTFTNNTTIDPEEMNQNFDDLLDEIKGAHHSDVDGTLIEPADINASWGLVPVGGVILWAGLIADVPAGYSFCNGSNGTIDLRNKFALCPGQDSGGTYDTGDTGGEANVTLTTAQLPAHNHGVTDPGHYHGLQLRGDGDNGSGSYNAESNDSSLSSFYNTNSETTGISIQNAGSGNAHNNMPPFKAVVYIQLTNL